MANYNILKTAIADYVKNRTGLETIDGDGLQQALLSIISSLGDGYQFIGVATPNTNPGTPDQRVFYIGGAGTYPNFGPADISDGNLAIFYFNNEWHFKTVELSIRPGTITESKLASGLVDKLFASGYKYAGKAAQTTNPGTPNQYVFYLASEPGTYEHFNNIIVADNEVAILKYNGTWSKDITGAANALLMAEQDERIAENEGAIKTIKNDIYTPFSGQLALSNYVGGSIQGAGRRVTGGAFRIYYFPCRKGDVFTVSYTTFDSSVAKTYAVYSTDDINEIGSVTALNVGPIGEDGGVYTCEITSDKAHLFCITDKGSPSVWGTVVSKVGTQNRIDLLGDSLASLRSAGYMYAGVATPNTSVSTPTEKVFYLAATAGTYTDFGGIELASGESVALVWNGTAWSKQIIGVLSSEGFYNVLSARRLPSTGNPFFLGTFASRSAARDSVPSAQRKDGLSITYKVDGDVITERFIGANTNYWLNGIYWQPENVSFVYRAGYRPQAMAPDKYIARILCNQTGLTLALIFNITKSGDSISFTSRVHLIDGVNNPYIGDISSTVLDDYATEVEHTFRYRKRYAYNPDLQIVVRVKELFADNISSVDVGSTTKLIDYVLDKDLGDQFAMTKGSTYPFEGVTGDINLNASRSTYVLNYLRAIQDIEIYGANETDGYLYQIYLLCKERTTNGWGNGVRIRRRNASDFSAAGQVDFKSPSAEPAVAAELNKIAGTSPQWMELTAWGLKFRILVDGSYLESGYNGEWGGSTLMGSGYYISPKAYRPFIPTPSQEVSHFDTLRDAVRAGRLGMFSVGQNPVIGFNEIPYNVSDIRPVQENYKVALPNPMPRMVKKSYLVQPTDGNGNLLYLCSDSKTRLFYTICPTNSRHINYTSREQYAADYIFFASKDNPTQLTKVVFPSIFPDQVGTQASRKKFVFEMSNGDILLEVENGTSLDANKRSNQIYKVTGLFNITPVDGVITVPVENISLSISSMLSNSRISSFMQITEMNKPGSILVAPYGTGATALIYYSENYGSTWEVIFSGITNNTTYNIPPKAEYEGTQTAYGEWPTAESVISSTPLDWSGTGNNNIHIHGIAYDRWMDRIWVCTGDGSGYPNGVSGIWWSDDIGRSWHRLSTRNTTVMGDISTQMMFPVPLEHSVLFATDGTGDGFFRWARKTKTDDIAVEPAYNFLGISTSLRVLGGRWSMVGEFAMASFNPDDADEGDFMYRGGIVATHNGFDFYKIYEDEFTEIGTITPDMTDEEKRAIYRQAFNTAQIGWSTNVCDCGDKIILSADKGGIIVLELE